MEVSFFSFLMAVIWSSLLIVLAYCIRKTRFYIQLFGVSWLCLLYMLCALRMVLPLEFSYTTVVASDGAFAQMMEFAHTKLFIAEAFTLNPIHLFFIIWMAATAILLLRLIYHYYRVRVEIRGYDKKEEVQYKNILKRIHRETNTDISLSILYSPDIDIPMGFGIFKKVILLPDSEYGEHELYYILLHEYTHFRNHDLSVKLLIHIFCCIFWWNPFSYLMQKDLSHTLEMKCDFVSCGNFQKQEKIAYLKAIVSVLKNADQENRKFVVSTAIAERGNSREMKERFAAVLQQLGKKQHKAISFVIMMVFIIMFFLLSYSFIFQPDYEAPLSEIETTKSAVVVDDGDLIIIKKKTGVYELRHIDGEFASVIDQDLAELYVKQGVKLEEE